MAASTRVIVSSTSSTGANTGVFWERLWATSGIQFVALCVIAYAVYGYQPQVGASPDALVAFYHGERTRILIAAIVSGFAVLYLMWFAAAIRATLADAGRDGWGAAATAASAAVGAVSLLLIGLVAGLAYSIAGSGTTALASGLNDFAWAAAVLSSFVRAMLVMAPTFGFWRAGLISNSLFAVGVAAVVLEVLGGTTWLSAGFWAPDGAYSRFISPLICLVWAVVISGVILKRRATRPEW